MDILKDGLKKMNNDLKDGNIKKQIANLLTLSRLFSPFVLLPLYYLEKYYLFIIMIIIFSLTDTFDGFLARKYHSMTLFGRYLDACVDKIFTLTLLIPVLNGYLLLVLLLEAIISIINLYSYYKKLNPITLYVGKIKTTFLFIFIGMLYLNIIVDFNKIYINILFIFTMVFQIIAIIYYLKTLKKDKHD